jgi:hypothetical protein
MKEFIAVHLLKEVLLQSRSIKLLWMCKTVEQTVWILLYLSSVVSVFIKKTERAQ